MTAAKYLGVPRLIDALDLVDVDVADDRYVCLYAAVLKRCIESMPTPTPSTVNRTFNDKSSATRVQAPVKQHEVVKSSPPPPAVVKPVSTFGFRFSECATITTRSVGPVALIPSTNKIITGIGPTVLDVRDGRLITVASHTSPVPYSTITMSNDGKYVAMGGDDVALTVRDVNDLSVVYPRHNMYANYIVFTHDCMIAQWRNVYVWQVMDHPSGVVSRGIQHPLSRFGTMAMCPYAKRQELMVADADGRYIRVLNSETLQEIDNLQTGFTAPITRISFSPTPGTMFIASSSDGTLRIWEPFHVDKKWRNVHHMPGHKKSVNDVKCLTSKSIVSVSDDGTLKVWDNNGSCVHTQDMGIGRLFDVDGGDEHVVISGENGVVSIPYSKNA